MGELKHTLLKLRRILRSRGNTRDDTDDLIQEAFLRLAIYCREHEVENKEAFIVRTAINLSIDFGKSRHYAHTLTETLARLQIHQAAPPTDEVYAVQERLLQMKAALDRMSPRRREVFILNRVEGYSFPQIAERLGITVSSVEKHAAQAALFLGDWIEQQQRKDQTT